jgi:hypothetical protein
MTGPGIDQRRTLLGWGWAPRPCGAATRRVREAARRSRRWGLAGPVGRTAAGVWGTTSTAGGTSSGDAVHEYRTLR